MGEWIGLPMLASAHGGRIDLIIVLIHAVMAVVFIGWTAFFAYVLWRFRRKRNPAATYAGVRSHASSYLEGGIAVIEILFLAALSIPFWAAHVDAMPEPGSNPVEVRVIAQQFAWNFHYPGEDGVFGRTDPALVDDVENPIGLDPGDPAAADDVTSLNVLHLPVDRPALIHLSTKDVIHSFALPEMRVKQDVIPGMTIPVHFTPTVTTDALRERTGQRYRDFEIACAQLCGLTHYRMIGRLIVETPEDFAEWLESKQS